MKRIVIVLVLGFSISGCGGSGDGRYQIVSTSGTVPSVFRVDTKTGEVVFANGGALSGSKPVLVVPAGPNK